MLEQGPQRLHWHLTISHPQFFAMWAFPCGLHHGTCFIRAASRKSPRVSTSQMEVIVFYSQILELTYHLKEKKKLKYSFIQISQFFHPGSYSRCHSTFSCHVSLVSLICNNFSVFPCVSWSWHFLQELVVILLNAPQFGLVDILSWFCWGFALWKG